MMVLGNVIRLAEILFNQKHCVEGEITLSDMFRVLYPTSALLLCSHVDVSNG